MEQIVVTDGYTLNPGDLDWNIFKSFGDLHLYDRISRDQIIERCKEATIVVTNKTPFDAETIDACKKLKMIAVTATGYNVIDVNHAKAKNILVCNVPDYGTDSVAQHTFALILELANHVGLNNAEVQKGRWSSNADWCFTAKPIVELRDKVLGMVGFGRIGQQVAVIAKAFGMNVLYFNPSPKQSSLAKQVSLEDVFKQSDIVSLHLPLKENNKAFVDHTLLSRMKRSAFLINTSRGPLINEKDLADALNNGIIAGAALDVLSVEPPPPDHPLIKVRNCIITPHSAWLSFEARQRILETTFRNVAAALSGAPQNFVY